MSNIPNINCPNGCPPASRGIGTNAGIVIWIFTEGEGNITNVTGLPPSLFSNGRQVDQTYQFDYAGGTSPEPPPPWPYKLESDPPCPRSDALGEEEPQLTNGPG